MPSLLAELVLFLLPKSARSYGDGASTCLNLLLAFFEFARRRGYVDSNPCAGIKVERDNDSEDEGWSPYWYLDAADQPRLLDACVEAGKEEAVLPQFALGTGLRLNEQ